MTIFNYQKLNRAQHHVECSVNVIAANAAMTHKLNSICNNKCTSCKKNKKNLVVKRAAPIPINASFF